MRRPAGTGAALALLALVFLILVPEPGIGDALLAAAAAGGALLAARPVLRAVEPPSRPPAGIGPALATLPGFVAEVAADVFGGAWRVALVTLGFRPAEGRIVEVPIGKRSPAGTAVTSFLITLSPGTLLVEVDRERELLLCHVLGEDPDRFRERVQRFYRERQRFLFP